MTVPAVNIVIEKGTDFEATYNVSNNDSSVYSLANQAATAKIRKHPTATTSISFTTTITTATGGGGARSTQQGEGGKGIVIIRYLT